MEVLLKRYFWLVHLFVVGVCALLSGRAASHILEGAYLVGGDSMTIPYRPSQVPSTAKINSKDPDSIIKRNLFCSGCSAAVLSEGASTAPTSNERRKTSLQLELISTMVCRDDDKWSVAVIRDLSTQEKDSEMYAQGKAIAHTGALVEKVVSRRVYLRHDGRREYLEFEGGAPTRAAPGSAPVLPQMASGLDPDIGDLDKSVTCTG